MALSFCGKRILTKRLSAFKTPVRNGYIVLVPEIGEDFPEKNPLYKLDGLPEFNNLTIENCMAAVGKQTLELEAGIKEIEDHIKREPITDVFKEVFDPLEILGAPLDTSWGLSKTFYLGNSSLMPIKSYLSIHTRAKQARAAKFNCKAIYDVASKELDKTQQRSDEQNRVIEKFVLEGKLNGLELGEDKKVILNEHLKKLLVEQGKYKTRVDAATKLFKQTVKDPGIVRDFPDDLLKATAEDPAQYLKGPWTITLQPSVYLPFMEHCPESNYRWNIWQAVVGRGSGYGSKELRTSIFLEEIRFLRHEQAKILGYKSYADMSMETKMAGSVDNVKLMLQTLLDSAKPAQERELNDLYTFANQRGYGGPRIELWDLPYWRRKQLKSVYNYTDEDFRAYFSLPHVLKGLFALCEKLFKISVKQRTGISTWHKDVRFYDIFEANSSTPVAGFYFDPYARTDEKTRIPVNSGSMVVIQNRSQITDTKPLAALIFNFPAPTQGKSSQLTFKEVNLLFHKFGHALQHLLTRTTYSEVSGLSNVEWDAVEICGYFLSHWLYTKSTIDSISKHSESEDKLPEDMFYALQNMRTLTAGIDLCRELYLSALDLELHSSRDFWLEIVKNLWPIYRNFPLDRMDSHPCAFTQIFAEEWAAAYYSHVWSRVIAADVFSAFNEVRGNEEGVAEVGKRFRDTFLALGGSCNPNQVFRKFRGRDPCPKALLSSLGLQKVERIADK